VSEQIRTAVQADVPAMTALASIRRHSCTACAKKPAA